MKNATSKLSLLTALLCLVVTVQAQVTNPNPSTFEVHLNTTTGATTPVDHLILRTEVEHTTSPSNGGGVGETTTLDNDHEWYISGGQDLNFSYDDKANSGTARQRLLQLNSTQMVGHVGQFRIANDNILVNASGVSFQGNNLQLGSSLTVDGFGATIDGDLLSVGNSLAVDGTGATLTGHNLQVGSGFELDASTLVLTGKTIKLSDGTDNQFRVTPNGVVTAREVNVNTGPIPDYVFEPDYDLMSIEELKAYIQEHGHLPNIASAEEYEQIGYVDLGELNLKLLEKVEEQSLYTIAQEEKINKLEADLEALRKDLEALKANK